MNIDNIDIRKGGNIIIGSIFEVGNGLDITLLVDKCRMAGCTLHFENEDITVDDGYGDDVGMRSKVMLYTLLAGHPKAAWDYFNFLYNQANKEKAPSD